MKSVVRFGARVLFLAGLMPVVACSSESPVSKPLVTDIDHTTVKRQSIGNCWLYAQATWLESELKVATGEEVDVSESYWTWWHWYGQIVNSDTTEVSTGGFWGTSAQIILNHGWVKEGQFIPSEQGVEMSSHQSAALAYINQQLQSGGTLATRSSRTPARVRQELDTAFGANMAQAEALANSASTTTIANGTTLAQALSGNVNQRWRVVSFPRIYGQNAVPSAFDRQQRKDVLRRVMKALNDYQPVVMSLMIDFNAMDTQDNGSFKKTLLDQAGAPGRQGGHMLVLEDYTVDNVPGFGTLGEGDMSDDKKAAAVNGDLRYLVSKNSWGKNRPERGLTDGYTRFYDDYLEGQIAWKNGEDAPDTDVSYYTTLTDFVLPPGY